MRFIETTDTQHARLGECYLRASAFLTQMTEWVKAAQSTKLLEPTYSSAIDAIDECLDARHFDLEKVRRSIAEVRRIQSEWEGLKVACGELSEQGHLLIRELRSEAADLVGDMQPLYLPNLSKVNCVAANDLADRLDSMLNRFVQLLIQAGYHPFACSRQPNPLDARLAGYKQQRPAARQ